MDAFSKRLRQLRVESGKLQTDISNELHFSRGSFSAYENGREPPYDTLVILGRYFDVSIDYLLGLSSDRRPTGDAVTTALEKLAPATAEAGGEPLSASDFAGLAEGLLEYYRRGAPAGNAPLEVMRAQLAAMNNLLTATLTGSTAQVLAAVNTASAAVLDLHKVLDVFLRNQTSG